MKRKTLAIFLGIAALMVSCTSNGPTQHKHEKGSLFFMDPTAQELRAAEQTTALLPYFHAYVYHADGSAFFDAKVTPVPGDRSHWEYNPVRMWKDAQGPLAVYAFWPSPAEGGYTYTAPAAGSAASLSYTPAVRAENQIDLVVASRTAIEEEDAPGIRMTFQHPLAEVEVQAACGDERFEIKVLGAKLTQFAEGGELALSNPQTAFQINDWSVPFQWVVNENSYYDGSFWPYPGGGNPLFDKYFPNIYDPLYTPVYTKRANYYAEASAESEAITLTGDMQSVMFGRGNFFVVPQRLNDYIFAPGVKEADTAAFHWEKEKMIDPVRVSHADISEASRSGQLRISVDEETIPRPIAHPQMGRLSLLVCIRDTYTNRTLYPCFQSGYETPNEDIYAYLSVPVKMDLLPGHKYVLKVGFITKGIEGPGYNDGYRDNYDGGTDKLIYDALLAPVGFTEKDKETGGIGATLGDRFIEDPYLEEGHHYHDAEESDPYSPAYPIYIRDLSVYLLAESYIFVEAPVNSDEEHFVFE